MTSTPLSSSGGNLSFRQQLLQFGIEATIVDALLASSRSVSLKKGDKWVTANSDALLIFIDSGCLAEFLTLSDGQSRSSSTWCPADITLSLPSEAVTKGAQQNHYLAAFDTVVTVVASADVYRHTTSSSKLTEFIVSKTNQYLFANRELAILRSSIPEEDNISYQLLLLDQAQSSSAVSITTAELSTMTGVNIDTCGNCIARLTSENVVRQSDNQIQILNKDQLIAQIESESLRRYIRAK